MIEVIIEASDAARESTPENKILIRCKDCAWHTKKHCAQFGLIGFDDDDYCSYAERKKK